ncbi:MAG: hypothetical protein OXI49_03520 [Acidobacteriota bacterium]|nr:hypothetical protein [Acidobacteriota bacterium]
MAFARVVVWAAGVFTLFSVCYFMVLVAGEAANGSVATRSVPEVHFPPLTSDD